MLYEKTKKAYDEVIDMLNKHREICDYEIDSIRSKANVHLFAIELKEKYGLNIEPDNVYSLEYVNINDYISIGYWGEKYNRTISWEDDGKQPKDELLLSIQFSTGAYIFGDDYPEELFKEFFQELKTYKPKYTDSANKGLYFPIKKAKNIFNEFQEILNNYNEKNKKESSERKIKKLEGELEQLNK